ncbi:SDR family NAD(P)-dependent oxidoreductase [Sabulicella rubraurantiaca]|uniref:SDR family NAD(P)-dependent oxidoreductase n=1 Tax=Sabulicella rubraurantiaca TaxID=2811429 RepID=UPI001A95638E|nr:SDR family oxidoreductase [Sabulicella rubraurantiaca]
MTPASPDPAARPHAVVTGSSSGIGAAVALHLLREGWRVTGLSRTPLPEAPDGYEHRAVDLMDPAETDAALDGLTSFAFVHAAGLMRAAALGALETEVGASLWRLHVEATFQMANRLVPAMAEGGRIVLLGSRASGGAAGRSQYAAGKAALFAAARSWAAELLPRRITVNVVAPAATDTPMLRDPARTANLPKLPPIGRYIAPEEVAALVAFLLGPYGGAITGQQILVCGGASL